MKYNKHILKKDRRTGEAFDEPQTLYYQMEDTNICIPEAPDNLDYDKMIEAVEAGEAEIVEVDDTPVPTWQDNRIAAYGSWREQLDHMYHGTWEDYVASVKATYPKPE